MGLADKYRARALKSQKSVIDMRRKNEEELDKIQKEEELKRKQFEKRRKEIREQEAVREKELVVAWGVVVMASGFVDKYSDRFDLLSAIIGVTMDKLESDPSAMDEYLAYLKEQGNRDKE